MKGHQILLDHLGNREAAALMVDGKLDDLLIDADAPAVPLPASMPTRKGRGRPMFAAATHMLARAAARACLSWGPMRAN